MVGQPYSGKPTVRLDERREDACGDGLLDGDTHRKRETRPGVAGPVPHRRLPPTLHLVILVDGYRRHDWLLRAVDRRLREEFTTLDLQLNEAKSRTVDLAQGEAFGFLGFDFRRVRSLRGAWRPQYTPQHKKRRALRVTLKEVFRRHRSQPIGRMIAEINPILRGWVNYFRIGHAGRCFAFVKDWVEKKVRRHMMRARKRAGFGWKRWRRDWLHTTLGLFKDYRVQYWARA